MAGRWEIWRAASWAASMETMKVVRWVAALAETRGCWLVQRLAVRKVAMTVLSREKLMVERLVMLSALWMEPRMAAHSADLWAARWVDLSAEKMVKMLIEVKGDSMAVRRVAWRAAWMVDDSVL